MWVWSVGLLGALKVLYGLSVFRVLGFSASLGGVGGGGGGYRTRAWLGNT